MVGVGKAKTEGEGAAHFLDASVQHIIYLIMRKEKLNHQNDLLMCFLGVLSEEIGLLFFSYFFS